MPLVALLFLFGGEAEEETVVFQEFADEEEGISRNDAIAHQTCDIIDLGVFIPFEKDLMPEFGELRIVLLKVIEQFILALANLFQRAVFSDGFLDGQHERLKIKHYLLRSREARKWTSGFWIHAFR